jgi:tripartite-type tricarboxylate transporter receptor subunit TctC
MHFHRRALLRVGAGAAALCCLGQLAGVAWSQASRVIKTVVPYPPGGGADVLARITADAIGAAGGPTMVVVNRPGAGTVIGTDDVVRAKPDGATLLITNNAAAIAPHMRKLDFDPLASLEPVCNIATTPTLVVVGAASPHRTLDDLLKAARAQPGKLTFGATPGGKSHIDFAMILHPAGVRMTLVPFNGTPPIVNAVLSGQVDAAFVDYPAAAGLLQSGTLRALAIGTPTRMAFVPDVPTIAELGLGDFDMEVWYGLFAPARTPMLAELARWIASAVSLPETKTRLAMLGMTAVGACGADFAAHFRRQYDGYGRIIRDADIKAE